MAQLVGKTISGCLAPAGPVAGRNTLPLSVMPPEPGMSWNVSPGAEAPAEAETGAAAAAGAAPRAAPVSRTAAVVIEAVVRRAGFGRTTGHSSRVSVQSDPTVTPVVYRW